MKKKLLSALLLAGTSVALFSCNNGDYTATPAGGTSGGGTSGGGIMSAKVNGVQWSASAGNYDGDSVLMIFYGASNNGTATGTKAMNIGISGYKGPKTYNLDGFDGTAIWADATTSPVTQGSASSGQLVVTSDQNNTIKGTFSWSGNGLTITDGTFNLAKK